MSWYFKLFFMITNHKVHSQKWFLKFVSLEAKAGKTLFWSIKPIKSISPNIYKSQSCFGKPDLNTKLTGSSSRYSSCRCSSCRCSSCICSSCRCSSCRCSSCRWLTVASGINPYVIFKMHSGICSEYNLLCFWQFNAGIHSPVFHWPPKCSGHFPNFMIFTITISYIHLNIKLSWRFSEILE